MYLRECLFYFRSKTKIERGDVECQFLEEISRPQTVYGMTSWEKGSGGQLAANVCGGGLFPEADGSQLVYKDTIRHTVCINALEDGLQPCAPIHPTAPVSYGCSALKPTLLFKQKIPG